MSKACSEKSDAISPSSRRRRKLSEPTVQAKSTLEETLSGLQKVSDLLQESLLDLETQNATTSSDVRVTSPPPIPPPRTTSSPNATPSSTRRRSDTEIIPQATSPFARRSARHSVCKMIVTQIQPARYYPISLTCS
jgi:hypothetical protein